MLKKSHVRSTFGSSAVEKVHAVVARNTFPSQHVQNTRGVQLFISHLARWLRTRRFSEHTFRPSGAKNHWKNIVFSNFPTFSRTCIFFLLILSLFWSSLFCSSPLWLFQPLLFHLFILLEVWLLNFLRLIKLNYFPNLVSLIKLYQFDMVLFEARETQDDVAPPSAWGNLTSSASSLLWVAWIGCSRRCKSWELGCTNDMIG